MARFVTPTRMAGGEVTLNIEHVAYFHGRGDGRTSIAFAVETGKSDSSSPLTLTVTEPYEQVLKLLTSTGGY